MLFFMSTISVIFQSLILHQFRKIPSVISNISVIHSFIHIPSFPDYSVVLSVLNARSKFDPGLFSLEIETQQYVRELLKKRQVKRAHWET